MQTELNKILNTPNKNFNHHLLVWASDALIYKKITSEKPNFENKHILKFRLFNQVEEYYCYLKKEAPIIRHRIDDDATDFIEKTVKLKSNISNLIHPNSTPKGIVSRDYIAYKANGQAYIIDSRMVAINELKLK